MTVAELIAELSVMPADAEVMIHFDGEMRAEAEAVWLAKSGIVVIGWLAEPVYSDDARILGAPAASESPYLSVSDMLLGNTPGTEGLTVGLPDV